MFLYIFTYRPYTEIDLRELEGSKKRNSSTDFIKNILGKFPSFYYEKLLILDKRNTIYMMFHTNASFSMIAGTKTIVKIS